MKFINLHTHTAEIVEDTINICNQYPKNFDEEIEYFSVGIHPWHINLDLIDAEMAIIESKMLLKNCLAIGECGFDKKIETKIDVQTFVFERQLLLANACHKTVIVHCVAAFDELVAIKKRMKITIPMIVHGFSKNEKVAKMLLDNEFYLSFGKHLMNNIAAESVLKAVPMNRLFLETDGSNFTIQEVYQKAADILKINIVEVKKNIFENFTTVF